MPLLYDIPRRHPRAALLATYKNLLLYRNAACMLRSLEPGDGEGPSLKPTPIGGPFFESPLYERLLENMHRFFGPLFDGDNAADDPAPFFYFQTFMGQNLDDLLNEGEPPLRILYHLFTTSRQGLDEVFAMAREYRLLPIPETIPESYDAPGYSESRIRAARLGPDTIEALLAFLRVLTEEDNVFIFPPDESGFLVFEWGDATFSAADFEALKSDYLSSRDLLACCYRLVDLCNDTADPEPAESLLRSVWYSMLFPTFGMRNAPLLPFDPPLFDTAPTMPSARPNVG